MKCRKVRASRHKFVGPPPHLRTFRFYLTFHAGWPWPMPCRTTTTARTCERRRRPLERCRTRDNVGQSSSQQTFPVRFLRNSNPAKASHINNDERQWQVGPWR